MFGTSINAGSLPLENSLCSSPVKFICGGWPSLSFCSETSNHYDLQLLFWWVSEYLVSLHCYKKITDQVAYTTDIYFSWIWRIRCVRLRHSQSWHMWEHFLVCILSSTRLQMREATTTLFSETGVPLRSPFLLVLMDAEMSRSQYLFTTTQ